MTPGTPRGFNLANMPPYFNGGNVPGNFQGMPGGNFGGFMEGVNQPGFNGLMAGDGAGMHGHGHHHQPGAMRRGGGRYSHRSGPYDRRGGGGNRGGSHNNYGRLSPLRGIPGMLGSGGRMQAGGGGNIPYIPHGHPAAAALFSQGGGGGPGGGPGGFPDGGSGQAMGPREAVQGRSLKSYEDLDAVGNSGSGELNY